MTQSKDRLDRIEQILEVTVQQQQNSAVVVAQQNAAIAKILEMQQVNASAIAQLGAQLESSTAHLIQTIDYAMGRMEEMLRRSLNPSQNGNPHLEF